MFLDNQNVSTKLLDPKFGVTKHFVNSLTGETEEGNQTKHQYIQDTYITNLAKKHVVLAHAISPRIKIR